MVNLLRLKIQAQQIKFGLRVFFYNATLRTCIKVIRLLITRYLGGNPVPSAVIISLTYKCQCDCLHCAVSDYTREEEDLTTKEIKSLLDFINKWGPIHIIFFGGEPLLRDDLSELVQYASKKGLRVGVDTNGILLNEDMVLKLKKSGVSNINVSIDSCRGSLHDQLRKKDGCFDAAIQGLKLCVKHKIQCVVSTYASKRAIRENDLESIISLTKQLGAGGVKVLFPILSGKWRREEEERLSFEEEEYVRGLVDPRFVYIEDALEIVRSGGRGCSAVRKYLLYVSPYGDIQPCFGIPVSFGNIRKEKIEQIVDRMRNHVFFKKFKSCKVCLVNKKDFRSRYFSNRSDREPLINANDIT